MAESTAADKRDTDDSLSAEEWTIIEKKETKIFQKVEKLNQPRETVVPEAACQKEKLEKLETGNVEEGDETGEKEFDSDISIISDENEEQTYGIEEQAYENEEQGVTDFDYDRSIVPLNWENLDEHAIKQLMPSHPRKSSRSKSDKSNVLLAVSATIMIIGAIIAGQLLHAQQNSLTTPVDTVINEKLKGMADLEAKFKELNDVKLILDQLQTTMPDIKKLIDTLAHQKHESTKPVPDESSEIWRKFERLYVQKLADYDAYDDRLELLEDTYRNVCLTVKKVNVSNIITQNDLCKTPKVLSKMIEFKRSVKRVFGSNNSQKPSEKRVFTEVDTKLDEFSESMLSELAVVFSKFTNKIEERLNKFGFKLSKRVCSIYSGRVHDKLLTAIMEDEFFTKYCNDSLNDITLDSKVNTRDEKDQEYKKKSYQEWTKNNYKQDYQKVKDYNKFEDSVEDYSSEKESSEENIGAKSKGELKYDNNWKKNKYENKDKYVQEEKKYNKHEKIDDNYKNENNKKTKEHFHESSHENKRENNHDRKFDSFKKERDNEKKHHNKKDHGFKSHYGVDEINNDDNVGVQLDNGLKFGPSIRIDVPENRFAKKIKDLTHSIYPAERKDKKDKYHPSGEWQMERFAPQSEDRRAHGEDAEGSRRETVDESATATQRIAPAILVRP